MSFIHFSNQPQAVQEVCKFFVSKVPSTSLPDASSASTSPEAMRKLVEALVSSADAIISSAPSGIFTSFSFSFFEETK